MSTNQYNYQQEDYEYDDNRNQIDIRESLAKLPPHQSFDVSSFAESKIGVEIPPKYIKGCFPKSNAPTLEVSPESKFNYLNRFKTDNIVNSNDYSNSKIGYLGEQLDQLKVQLKQRQTRLDNYILKIQQLNHTNLKLEKLIRQKDIVIRDRQQQLLEQQKKIRQLNQNSCKSSASAIREKSTNQVSYIEEFCPQLLSPEESLQLFYELLAKLNKSTSIKRKISNDKKTIQLLNKLTKIQ